jgi:Uncharacterized protein conserved in bacteria
MNVVLFFNAKTAKDAKGIMKRFISYWMIVVVMMAVVIGVSGQAKPEVKFDADLAKKLGADERGMRQYIMCFLKTGPLKVDDAKRAELMKGHFAMINRAADLGKLVIAGPFVEGGEFRGIYIFDVKTIDEAKQLTETDPSIKEGYFKVEFIKWYGSAALMQVNDTHGKIAKKGI